MEFSYQKLKEKRKKSDALVLPFWKEKNKVRKYQSAVSSAPLSFNLPTFNISITLKWLDRPFSRDPRRFAYLGAQSANASIP